MRTLFKNLMRGKMYSTDRYVYYDFSIEEHERECTKLAIQNKQKGIPLEVTIQLVMLTIYEAEITIDKKHKHPIYRTKAELEQVRNDLADIRGRYAEYVESEKKTIGDKEFEAIDKLEAKLRRLENQSQEQEKMNSTLNEQDHEGQDER